MNFHETPMGRKFFEVQLPQLIQSIQKLTDAMDKRTQPLVLPEEADPEFLSALYYGNYEPASFRETPESEEINQKVKEAYEELTPLLPEVGHEKLMKYQDTLNMRECVNMQMAYESGFRTAVQMIMAGMSRPQK